MRCPSSPPDAEFWNIATSPGGPLSPSEPQLLDGGLLCPLTMCGNRGPQGQDCPSQATWPVCGRAGRGFACPLCRWRKRQRDCDSCLSQSKDGGGMGQGTQLSEPWTPPSAPAPSATRRGGCEPQTQTPGPTLHHVAALRAAWPRMGSRGCLQMSKRMTERTREWPCCDGRGWPSRPRRECAHTG